MLELLFVQVLIVGFLLTYRFVEEQFLAKDITTKFWWWEQELEWRSWMDELGQALDYDDQPLDRVAAGMDLAGWHPLYGAEGWAGVPYGPDAFIPVEG